MAIFHQLIKSKIFCKAAFRQRVWAGVVFIFIAGLFYFLWLAGAGEIDIDRWVNPCGFEQKYGLPCPTCFVTRAAIKFIRGNVLDAFYIQPAGAFISFVLLVTAFLAFIASAFGVYFSFLKVFRAQLKIKYVILALVIVIAGGWAVTFSRAIINR